MAFDLEGLERAHHNPGKPTFAHGVVIEGPRFDGTIIVQIYGWPQSTAYPIIEGRWMPRPNPSLDGAGGAGPPLTPEAGDHCLLVFDHVGDGWVPVWGFDRS